MSYFNVLFIVVKHGSGLPHLCFGQLLNTLVRTLLLIGWFPNKQHRHHLGACYKCRISGSHTRLLPLHLNKISRRCVCAWNFEKYSVRICIIPRKNSPKCYNHMYILRYMYVNSFNITMLWSSCYYCSFLKMMTTEAQGT